MFFIFCLSAKMLAHAPTRCVRKAFNVCGLKTSLLLANKAKILAIPMKAKVKKQDETLENP
ncbi:MAG: hypothetical protein IJJ33_03445 [Victivallales bacterium]|nr:hypothetical protein [Victivallales bacterium]